MLRHVSFIAAAAALLVSGVGIAAASAAEPPLFAERVSQGKLPPMAERLPKIPMVADFAEHDLTTGRHGGDLRLIFGRAKDIRLMVVYGYSRLVGYDRKLRLRPDILADIEVTEGRKFTMKLRPGHKWSDGHPFTAEDFRYYWEEIIGNKKLSPIGPPAVMKVDGEKALFRVIDEHTVEFSWSKPNPYFLPALAGARPLYIYRPAHYLKQFHAKYADAKKLAKLVKKKKRRNWAALHHRMDNQYKNNNPKLPTLQPWVLKTKPPSKRFVFERNPYFHRADPDGRQLPYADRVILNIAASSIIPAKTGTGESDVQARSVHFNNYTFLKASEKRVSQKVKLWQTAKGSHVALFPNLNHNDPVWRKLFRDVRFRRALSMAVHRHEINQVIYFGLAIKGNNTALPQSPLFKKDYQTAWTQFDLKAANALLDQIGLDKKDSDGIRMLPDGRRLEIIVETAGEDTEQTDILELVRDSWAQAGIKLFTRPSQREVFRNRIFAGETMVSIWSGLENGLPTPRTSPKELAPTSQQQLQWPKWGQYVQTGGRSGEEVDMPAARELKALNKQWERAKSVAEKEAIWHKMLAIHADRVFTIGLISGVLQPVVVSNRMRNVPDKGVYNWDPGAHFGIYRPDTFWIDSPQARAGTD